MNKLYFSLPVEIVENNKLAFDDSLIPVDIKVMHSGLNLNNSIFYDNAIEDAKESLKNKPILGYIKKVDGTDEKDFAGHEKELTINEEGLTITYLERPIGVIPETNFYSILKENDKDYVFCRGYLWKEYLNEGYEVLKNNPNKSVSMEIVVDDYEMNEDGTINIIKYRYLGVTVLGDNYEPAMAGAEMNVLGEFSTDKHKEFFKKIEELNKKLKQYSSSDKTGGDEGGGENVKDEKFDKEVKEEKTVDDIQENNKDVNTNEDKDTTIEENHEEIVDNEEVFVKSFELSHEDVRIALYKLLDKVEEEDDCYYYINAVYDDYFIYSSWDDDIHYKQGYVKTDVDVALQGERIRLFVEYLTSEELEELKKMRENYQSMSKELEELKKYKTQKEQEEFEEEQKRIREEKINHINTEYANISEKIRNMFIGKVDEYESIKDIDADMCVYIVKNKLSFSRTTENKQPLTKVKVDKQLNKKGLSPYGNLF